MRACWISAGVSSFIAGYLTDDVDEYLYIDIADQHPDSMRFIRDCEDALGKRIIVLRSRVYRSVDDVIAARRYVNGPAGAPCTVVLKKQVRRDWELAHYGDNITYVWGFDCTETNRANRVEESLPSFNHEFPLIDRCLNKSDAHGILRELGIKRPAMYDLGYQNNNCIGCVKGGMGYWNKIRVDFPDVFELRKTREREIGHSCIKGVFLDELDPNRGRIGDEIMEECSLLCQLNIKE